MSLIFVNQGTLMELDSQVQEIVSSEYVFQLGFHAPHTYTVGEPHCFGSTSGT